MIEKTNFIPSGLTSIGRCYNDLAFNAFELGDWRQDRLLAIGNWPWSERKAAEDSRTPRRYRVIRARRVSRQRPGVRLTSAAFVFPALHRRIPSRTLCPCGPNQSARKTAQFQLIRAIRRVNFLVRRHYADSKTMSTPPTTSEPNKPKLAWYQHVWLALPFALVAVGGAIGGACGGTAWAINQKVFQKTEHPVLRYVWTGLISAAAVVAYIIFASVFISLFKKQS
jgi:hypothetical protein